MNDSNLIARNSETQLCQGIETENSLLCALGEICLFANKCHLLDPLNS